MTSSPDEDEIDRFLHDLRRRARIPVGYRLEGHEPVPEYDIEAFARWTARTEDRRVALTQIGTVEISTVFLGFDHYPTRTGPPLLFETMVFRPQTAAERADARESLEAFIATLTDDDARVVARARWAGADRRHALDEYTRRYATWDEAEAGHVAVVAEVHGARR